MNDTGSSINKKVSSYKLETLQNNSGDVMSLEGLPAVFGMGPGTRHQLLQKKQPPRIPQATCLQSIKVHPACQR